MNLISELCPVDDILLTRDIASKGKLFVEVARHFEARHGLAAKNSIDGLNAREELGSTAVGNGVAIPHARIVGLNKMVAAFIRPKNPIPFDAPDRMPVSDILVLLVPEESTQEHLQVLANVAHLFSDRQFREQLQACTDAAAVNRIFSDWQAKT